MAVLDVLASRTAVRCRRRGAAGLREIALLTGLYVFYSLTRLFADGDLGAARGHALHLVHLENLLGMHVESWASATVASHAWLAVPASFWYATLHYLVTPAVMLFVYLRHRDDYSRVRTGLVIGSAIGLVGFLLLPTAPPRLMPDGYTDVLAQYAGWGWWSDAASVPSGLGGMSNELAAMPSLHVGWTLWVAWALWDKVGRVGKVVAATYVVGTSLVVIGTGNHWVLDVLAGLLVIAIGCRTSTRLHAKSGRDADARVASRAAPLA